MSEIVPMILERIRSHLQKVLIDDVALNSTTRVNEVKVGRYQQNPNEAMYRIAIMPGDLDDAKYLDGLVDRADPGHDLGFVIESREIGNTQFWYRRGTVRIELFFIGKNLTEDEARDIAYCILGRTKINLENIYVADLVDDFGEKASQIISTGITMFQSGGPPTSWIFHGKIFWDCLTNRDQ